MTDHSTASDRPNADDAAFEQAVRWLTRLREEGEETGGTGASEIQAAFQAWLDGAPENRRAFAEAERLWGRLELPVQRLSRGYGGTKPRRRRSGTYRAAALAACLTLLITGGWTLRDDIAIGLQSDYTTSVGTRSPIELTDGSRVTLNTDSAIAVDMNGADRHVRLLRGEAWFDVAADRQRPFVVDTAMGRVRVTGTQFNLRMTGGGTEVSLAEGQVKVIDNRGTILTLTPGHRTHLTATGVSAPETFDETAVTAWLRGQFVFYDAPLSHVVAEINRYRRGRIIVADSAVRNLKVSGVFRTDAPDAALSAITDTLPLRATRLTNYLVVLH
jgi:transmembrane sensor